MKLSLLDLSEPIKFKAPTDQIVFNDSFFSKIETEEAAYWLGTLYPSSKINEDALMVSKTMSKRHEIMEFMYDLKTKGNVEFKITRTNNPMLCLTLTNKKIVESLMSSGLKEKSVPVLSKSLQRHFWRGAIDTAGSMYGCTPNDSYGMKLNISFSKPIMEDFMPYLRSVIDTKMTPRYNSGIYRVTLNHAMCRDFVQYMYHDSTRFSKQKMSFYEEHREIKGLLEPRIWEKKEYTTKLQKKRATESGKAKDKA